MSWYGRKRIDRSRQSGALDAFRIFTPLAALLKQHELHAGLSRRTCYRDFDMYVAFQQQRRMMKVPIADELNPSSHKLFTIKGHLKDRKADRKQVSAPPVFSIYSSIYKVRMLFRMCRRGAHAVVYNMTKSKI